MKGRKMFKTTPGVVATLGLYWNDNNIEKVWHQLLQNCHLSLWLIVDELDISKDTVRKALTVEQKEYRVAACQDVIEMAVSDAASFKNNVTGDESWCFAYDPAMKRHSSAWVAENLPCPQKLWFQKSSVKTMLMMFVNWQRVMHKELVLEGQTGNFEFYREVMDLLLQRLRRVRPDKAESRYWFCCMIMLIPSTQLLSSSFLQRKASLFFTTPLPDLAPAD